VIIYDPDGRDITMAEYVARYPTEGVVADTDTPTGHHVATLWVGIDDRLTPTGPPLIYETLVTGPGAWHGHTERYATRDQATAGHHQIVADLTTQPDRHTARYPTHDPDRSGTLPGHDHRP